MRFRQFYITEAALMPIDLGKPGKEYPVRGQVLIKKIENREPFEMMDGTYKQLKVSPTDMKKLKTMAKNLSFKTFNKEIQLMDTSNNVVRLAQLKKNEEFGSSKGSGGGSATTDLAESAAAMMAAWFVSNKISSAKKAIEFFNKLSVDEMTSEFNKVSGKFNTTSTPQEVSEFLKDSTPWFISSMWTSEAIIKELKPKTSHTFHRGSQLVTSIYEKSKKLLKDANYSMRDDKWNPADIWMIDESSPSIKKLENTNNIVDFNAILAKELGGKKGIVGISLKQSSNSYPPIAFFNLDADENEEAITIDEIDPKVLGRKPMAKDVVIIDNDPVVKMIVRDFFNRTGAPVVGELAGKKAAGGKVGHNVMVNWLHKNVRGAKIKVYDKKEIIKNNDISHQFLLDMMVLINSLKRMRHVDTSKLKKIKKIDDLKIIVNDMKKREPNILNVAATLSSKIQAFQIAKYSNDDFFDFVNSYASSSVKGVSGPFIKIGK